MISSTESSDESTTSATAGVIRALCIGVKAEPVEISSEEDAVVFTESPLLAMAPRCKGGTHVNNK